MFNSIWITLKKFGINLPVRPSVRPSVNPVKREFKLEVVEWRTSTGRGRLHPWAVILNKCLRKSSL